MKETRNSQSANTRFGTSLKVGVAVAVLSLVALTAEQPRLSAATASHSRAVSEVAYVTVSETAANDAMAGAGRDMSVPTPMSASTADYFPAHFPAPQADAEPLPPTF